MFGSNFGKIWCLIVILLIIFLVIAIASGCQTPSQHEVFDTNSAIDLLKSFQTVNSASASINPFALPVGAGLAGLVAMLESLRRVEKGKRKYAEHELNNNKNNHT